MYFYDAAAPIVTEESIDKDKVFKAARYDKGTADYINCPMTKEEYTAFYNELITAETAPLKEFENQKVFEGCMPVEVMAKRGEQTLVFGPLNLSASCKSKDWQGRRICGCSVKTG